MAVIICIFGYLVFAVTAACYRLFCFVWLLRYFYVFCCLGVFGSPYGVFYMMLRYVIY